MTHLKRIKKALTLKATLEVLPFVTPEWPGVRWEEGKKGESWLTTTV